jgi:hypothetical protein
MTVGRRAHDRLSGDTAASACPVFDEEGLAEAFRQPLTDQARYDVRAAARRKPNKNAHRLRRIGLRLCDAGETRKNDSTPLPDAEIVGEEAS